MEGEAAAFRDGGLQETERVLGGWGVRAGAGLSGQDVHGPADLRLRRGGL